jgi:hypothetical protein
MLGNTMTKMLFVIEDLYKICISLEEEEDMKVEIIRGQEFMRRVREVETKFDKYSLFFFKMVKTEAAKGSFKELYLKLDYNGYFTRLIDNENLAKRGY